MSRYIQDLLPLIQVNPGIMDVIDFDKFAQQMAIARGTPRIILRSSKDIAAIRQQKQQQQAMQNIAQTALPATQSIKNLADANSKGFQLPELAQLGHQ